MNYKKIMSMVLMILITSIMIYCFLGFDNEVNALSPSDLTAQMSDISINTAITNSSFGGFLKDVIGYIQIAGTGIAIIVVTILGIKYLTASVEAKAEIKKDMMPVLIGMGLLFAGVNLVGIAANVVGLMFG